MAMLNGFVKQKRLYWLKNVQPKKRRCTLWKVRIFFSVVVPWLNIVSNKNFNFSTARRRAAAKRKKLKNMHSKSTDEEDEDEDEEDEGKFKVAKEFFFRFNLIIIVIYIDFLYMSFLPLEKNFSILFFSLVNPSFNQ